jgi:hypothetical protein
MNPELREKAGEYDAGSLPPSQPAPDSEGRIRQSYEHFSGILELYHLGRAAITDLEARKLESNTQTLARILERIRGEDCGAAARRLRRASVLVSELEEIEGAEGRIVYTPGKAEQTDFYNHQLVTKKPKDL